MPRSKAILVLTFALAGCSTQSPVDALRPGMTLERFEALLGVTGEYVANPSPEEATVNFDLDYVRVEATVVPGTAEATVKDFFVGKDSFSAAERKARRDRAWSNWVRARHQGTNVSPAKASEPDVAPQVPH